MMMVGAVRDSFDRNWRNRLGEDQTKPFFLVILHPDMSQPPIVMDQNVPLVGREHVLAERPELNVRKGNDVHATLRDVASPTAFVTTGTQWCDGYLDALADGDWVTTVGAGYDKYPVTILEERGITLTNTPHAPIAAVAEHAFAMAFSYTRRLWHFRDRQRSREWDRPWLTVSDLAGDICCIVGLGRIGEAIAERALAFGMTVRGVKRSVEDYDGVADEVYPTGSLWEALAGTRLLVLAVPLTDATDGLIGAAELERVAANGIVVNVARGPVLDMAALRAALRADEVAAACLDVTDPEPLPDDSPLWDDEDVFVTPHAGGHSEKYPERFLSTFLPQYDRWRAGAPLNHRIV